jgi:hypothetical protein
MKIDWVYILAYFVTFLYNGSELYNFLFIEILRPSMKVEEASD